MSDTIDVTNLVLDGIPTRCEKCTLTRDGDAWQLTIVGFFEVFGVQDKIGEHVPVSFDAPEGRHGGVASVVGVEHEQGSEERMIVQLEGTKPLR